MMMADTLAWDCRGLTVQYAGQRRPALDDVTLSVTAGACTAVLGPNGSGKSTLLRTLLGVQAPTRGRIACFGRALSDWPRTELARTVGVVAQSEVDGFPVTVREMVGMGRYPHLGAWRREGKADIAAIERAMAQCDVAPLADRAIDQLSGGERQRVRVARALAQEPKALVLDEPTASLDLAHEMAILTLLRTLANSGVTVLVVTHHLALAARYADHVVLMREGHVDAVGGAADVLTAERLERVFDWPVSVGQTPDGTPYIVPKMAGR